MSRTAGIVIVLVAGALLVRPAAADVDVEVGNANKVLGTIDPVGEDERLRFVVPGGATITAKAAGARKGPPVGIALRDPDDVARGLPTPRGKGASITVATAA